jgi:hypothetical protein
MSITPVRVNAREAGLSSLQHWRSGLASCSSSSIWSLNENRSISSPVKRTTRPRLQSETDEQCGACRRRAPTVTAFQ